MKTRKIIDICKKSGTMIIFEGEEVEWISDGSAAYPMFDVPSFNKESICRTYDITDKQAEKIYFRHEHALPTVYDFGDCIEGENAIEHKEIRLVMDGRELIPYMTSQGVEFVDAKYLRPFSDIEEGMLNLYERQTANGQIYFAVKSGFMLIGIIMPVEVISKQFVTQLNELAKQCEISVFNKKTEDDE